MDDAEKLRVRGEILDEVGALLQAELAADEWGRVLVEVVREGGEGGEPVVAGIDVEDIVGDEARVDAVFGSDATRALLPVLAKATEALCELEEVDLDDVRGGTFLRQRGGGFVWLPGLVRLPSAALEAEWDALGAKLEAKNAALEARFHLGEHDRYDVDREKQTLVFSKGGQPRVVARAVLIATFADASRVWAWGGYNKNLPESVRQAAAALADAVPERDIWEVSTPMFPTDAGTAWVLGALVCDRAGGDGVYRTPTEGGRAYLLLRDVRDA
ncbi:MAG TPA: hypothetical protein VHS09_04145 [Polyangiaceae bacterium]|jgi:hypothetical protein|nr:hypothetical protein [Polyangiaceae bacterium]